MKEEEFLEIAKKIDINLLSASDKLFIELFLRSSNERRFQLFKKLPEIIKKITKIYNQSIRVKNEKKKEFWLLWEGEDTRFGRVSESEIPRYIKLYGKPTKKWVI